MLDKMRLRRSLDAVDGYCDIGSGHRVEYWVLGQEPQAGIAVCDVRFVVGSFGLTHDVYPYMYNMMLQGWAPRVCNSADIFVCTCTHHLVVSGHLTDKSVTMECD